jgi:pimeloyl-ACP methyl ester carboxylesterase
MRGRATVPCRDHGERVLTFETWGPSDGVPVFLLHGTPGSRLGPRPRTLELDRLGVRLIAFDRPGYGGSERLPGRKVADAADDVAAVADALGLSRFAVVGRSGGAPHALASAAELPGRVFAAASLVGLAPYDAEGLDWYERMGGANEAVFRIAVGAVAGDDDTVLLARLAQLTSTLVARDVEFIRAEHDAQMPTADRAVIADAGIRQVLRDNFCGAVSHAGNLLTHADHDRILAGWLDDLRALTDVWGFKVETIDVPVLLWHGGQDNLFPAGHSVWLHEHIPGAQVINDAESAHFGALGVLPHVLTWVRQFA